MTLRNRACDWLQRLMSNKMGSKQPASPPLGFLHECHFQHPFIQHMFISDLDLESPAVKSGNSQVILGVRQSLLHGEEPPL